MAKVNIEVDEEELVRNQKLRNTLAAMTKHPKAALLVEEAYKLVEPNAVTPALDAHKAQNEPIQAVQKQLSEFLEAQKAEKAEREKNEKLARLNADFDAGRKSLKGQKWTDDGIKKLEEFMEQKGILDHEIAAAAFEKLHPPQTPVTPNGSGSWNFLDVPKEGDDDIKALIASRGENEGLLRKMSNEALMEVRNTR